MSHAAAAPPRPEDRTPPAPSLRLAAAGWAAGLLAPPLGAGVIAALALAASLPPLVWLTGLGRWQIQPVFQSMAFGMALWLLTAPLAALALVALRTRIRPLPAALAAGLAPALICPFATAWASAGGPFAQGFLAELLQWTPIYAPFAFGSALWLGLTRAAARGLAARRRPA